jgi:release factor H-coupled RctB family protein
MHTAVHSPAATIRVLASPQSWIEGDALRQLEAVARLPGMRAAIGMPDLHPGRGAPVGAAFACAGFVHPFLVGNDIGCGIGLWRTDLPVRKARRDKWVRRLRAELEEPLDEADTEGALEAANVGRTGFDRALGTIGGGNHFAELTVVDEVFDASALRFLGLEEDRFALLVHSGSRGLGEFILREHVDRFAADGLSEQSPEAGVYLERHDHAVAWGQLNRALIARRFLDCVGGEGERALDVCHNSVTRAELGGEQVWLHRKGAAPADQGPVVIAGSRGTRSYLVLPAGDPTISARSLAHGAGRKWKRSDARERLEDRYPGETLTRTALGGVVICDDRALLYEEAPQAYKNIEQVISDLRAHGLIKLVAALAPRITFKTTSR